MYLESFFAVTFYKGLHRIDVDLAERTKQGGCPYCGGRLDAAWYERKPRGGPAGLPDEVSLRMSLCCGREGCRCRTLPPSCLFLGRKVYWGAIVLVVVAMRQRRPRSASAGKLKALFDVSWETVKRWMVFFTETFPRTAMWKKLRGMVPAGVRNDDLPAGLIELFVTSSGDERAGLVRCLAFLSGSRTTTTEHVR